MWEQSELPGGSCRRAPSPISIPGSVLLPSSHGAFSATPSAASASTLTQPNLLLYHALHLPPWSLSRSRLSGLCPTMQIVEDICPPGGDNTGKVEVLTEWTHSSSADPISRWKGGPGHGLPRKATPCHLCQPACFCSFHSPASFSSAAWCNFDLSGRQHHGC